jgi:hypothetical protein
VSEPNVGQGPRKPKPTAEDEEELRRCAPHGGAAVVTEFLPCTQQAQEGQYLSHASPRRVWAFVDRAGATPKCACYGLLYGQLMALFPGGRNVTARVCGLRR